VSKAVAEKILKVMMAIDYLKKDGNVQYGSTRYSYLSEEKVTSCIREAMRDAGLVIVPVGMEVISEKDIQVKSGTSVKTLIKVNYLFVDTDTGESIQASALGEGMDVGDKGIYKAMTGAYKYVQRETFMIPTGDDPDKTSSDELAERNGRSGSKPANTQTTKPNNKPSAGAIICEGCDCIIEDDKTHTAKQIAVFSKKLHGKVLCKACQNSIKK